MIKFIFKYIAKLFVKLSKWDVLGFGTLIKHLYQAIRQEEFVIYNQYFHRVKKGKIRYELMIFETSEGNIKLNLGRHRTDEVRSSTIKPVIN